VRFLLDENAEYRIAHLLQMEGHDVTAIAHDYPHALTDPLDLFLVVTERSVRVRYTR
jgi:hypothetical protein